MAQAKAGLTIFHAPKHVTAKMSKAGKLTVKWKGIGGAERYQVAYRALGAKKWKKKSTRSTKIAVAGTEKGKVHEYRVRAVDEQSGVLALGKWSKKQTVARLTDKQVKKNRKAAQQAAVEKYLKKKAKALKPKLEVTEQAREKAANGREYVVRTAKLSAKDGLGVIYDGKKKLEYSYYGKKGQKVTEKKKLKKETWLPFTFALRQKEIATKEMKEKGVDGLDITFEERHDGIDSDMSYHFDYVTFPDEFSVPCKVRFEVGFLVPSTGKIIYSKSNWSKELDSELETVTLL